MTEMKTISIRAQDFDRLEKFRSGKYILTPDWSEDPHTYYVMQSDEELFERAVKALEEEYSAGWLKSGQHSSRVNITLEEAHKMGFLLEVDE